MKRTEWGEELDLYCCAACVRLLGVFFRGVAETDLGAVTYNMHRRRTISSEWLMAPYCALQDIMTKIWAKQRQGPAVRDAGARRK